jgi:hypothetical protein
VLQTLIGIGTDPSADAMLMTVAGREIPMNVKTTLIPDGRPGPYLLTTFTTFGGSLDASLYFRIGPTVFESQSDERELQLLAVEALLAFGSFGDGLIAPAGTRRVLFEEHQWTLSDFGYTTDEEPKNA